MLAGASAAAEERGRDPFAFRAVLDEKPRMLVLALRPDFWVAYDAERAALYKVWEGGVHFTGAVYDWLHGPQPTSQGRAWLVSPWEEPWQVARGGEPLPARVRYRGHRLDAGRATLLYDLELGDGARIRVAESPEAVRAADGARGLERRFTTSGVPAGVEVRLRVAAAARRARRRPSRRTAASRTRRPRAGGALDGVLVLRANATTRFVAWLAEPTLDPAQPEAVAADLPAGLALIEAERLPRLSPRRAPHRRARRSRRSRAATPTSAPRSRGSRASVLLGGAGAWGETPMTAHPSSRARTPRRWWRGSSRRRIPRRRS